MKKQYNRYISPSYTELTKLGYKITSIKEESTIGIYNAFASQLSPYRKYVNNYYNQYGFRQPMLRAILIYAYTLDNMQQFEHKLDNGLYNAVLAIVRLIMVANKNCITKEDTEFIRFNSKFVISIIDAIELYCKEEAIQVSNSRKPIEPYDASSGWYSKLLLKNNTVM